MMLRITDISSASSDRRLKLEGRVAGGAVEPLQRHCEELLAAGGREALVLDVAEVSFIDGEGVALFRSLCRRNVVVVGSSAFVAELLKEVLPC